MSLLHARPIRWFAGGAAALVLTIWSALMLGLNVPSVRPMPLEPWAGAGYGADRHEDSAIGSALRRVAAAAAVSRPGTRVAGVRLSKTAPPAPEPAPEPRRSRPSPALPVLPPALQPAVPSVPSLPQAPDPALPDPPVLAAPGVAG